MGMEDESRLLHKCSSQKSWFCINTYLIFHNLFVLVRSLILLRTLLAGIVVVVAMIYMPFHYFLIFSSKRATVGIKIIRFPSICSTPTLVEIWCLCLVFLL